MKEKKIFLKQKDGVDEIIKYLKNLKEEKIYLVVPKNSVLGNKMINFEILKKETERFKKEIIICSINEHILELAALNGFKTFDEFFMFKENFVMDVVLDESKKILNTKAIDFKSKTRTDFEKEENGLNFFRKNKKNFDLKKEFKSKSKLKFIISISLILVLVVFFVIFYLPKMELVINFRKENVEFEKKVVVDKNFLEIKEEDVLFLPGEVITLVNNLEKKFPAQEKQLVSLKTKGKISVFNAYSSKSQVLIKNTRFLSPDNKIYRIQENITVPGAKLDKGKIIPSFIVVDVVADEPGSEYNILTPNPDEKWTIPGFKDTDKYFGFYALANQGPISGGFKGEKFVVKETELEEIKKQMIKELTEILETKTLVKDLSLKVLNEPFFELLKIDYAKEVDNNNNFSVFLEGKIKQIAFKENDLKQYLINKYKSDLERKLGYDLVLDKIDLFYKDVLPDFNNEKLNFVLKAFLVFKPKFDENSFKEEILNLKENDFKNKVYGLKGFESAKINFWPFWFNRSPILFKDRILIKIN